MSATSPKTADTPAGLLQPARRGAPPPAPGLLTRLGPPGRAFLFLLVLLLLAVVTLAPLFPRSVTPAAAPPERFSAERALAHLPTIAREPHPVGSPAQARVRDYLVAQLSALGVETEVQRARGVAPPGGPDRAAEVENVVARLPGSAPTGAVVLLAHYDSVPAGAGAADNGSGVAALLEVMRALAAGPTPRNDVIALFDDGEEVYFLGTQAFVAGHPWMRDVRVAISLDTAVAGPAFINDTGPRNGWLVRALARAYTGGVWSSASGGGRYDYYPFRVAGIQGLALEDNYPFREQHTALDRVEIVGAASVQQLGEQALAIARELGALDLANPWDEHATFFALPVLGLVHYPQAWAGPLAAGAALLLALALGLALWRGLASRRGLAVALGAILAAAVASGVVVGAVWAAMPGLAGWDTARWPEWPEVVPPHGELLFAGFMLIVLVLTVPVYRRVRRSSRRTELSLAGLVPFAIVALALAAAEPRAAFVPTWSVLIGALGWIAAAAAGPRSFSWSVGSAAFVAAAPLIVLFLPVLPQTFMGNGLSNAAILALGGALLLGVLLPAVDSLIVRQHAAVRDAAPIQAGDV